jgi:hypothetical protein
MKIISACVAILLLSGNACASGCTTVAEMDKADTVSGNIHNWRDVNSFFHNFKQCDDGYIAEGLSATITRLLATNWNSVDQLEVMTAKDKAFESWVLNHIDTTADSRDLEKIIKHAKEECVQEHKQFCAKVGGSANQALDELKQSSAD